MGAESDVVPQQLASPPSRGPLCGYGSRWTWWRLVEGKGSFMTPWAAVAHRQARAQQSGTALQGPLGCAALGGHSLLLGLAQGLPSPITRNWQSERPLGRGIPVKQVSSRTGNAAHNGGCEWHHQCNPRCERAAGSCFKGGELALVVANYYCCCCCCCCLQTLNGRLRRAKPCKRQAATR